MFEKLIVLLSGQEASLTEHMLPLTDLLKFVRYATARIPIGSAAAERCWLATKTTATWSGARTEIHQPSFVLSFFPSFLLCISTPSSGWQAAHREGAGEGQDLGVHVAELAGHARPRRQPRLAQPALPCLPQ